MCGCVWYGLGNLWDIIRKVVNKKDNKNYLYELSTGSSRGSGVIEENRKTIP
jgi:hypothetical protein